LDAVGQTLQSFLDYQRLYADPADPADPAASGRERNGYGPGEKNL
jgi:hypothetical protein